MTRTARFIVAVVLMIPVALVAAWLLWDRYPAAISDALAGELKQVTIRPHVDREIVVITDAGHMEAIREAVKGAQVVSTLTYQVARFPLIFEFADGRRVELLISATGLSPRHSPGVPLENAISTAVTISWQGYMRVAVTDSVIVALRAINALAAPAGE